MRVVKGRVIPVISIEENLAKRLKGSGKTLILHITLKFSCLIAKRFRAEVGEPPEGCEVFEVDGVRICVVFRAVGSKFCGDGFEEIDFPILNPERFFPKWIRVNSDLSGEFGYL